MLLEVKKASLSEIKRSYENIFTNKNFLGARSILGFLMENPIPCLSETQSTLQQSNKNVVFIYFQSKNDFRNHIYIYISIKEKAIFLRGIILKREVSCCGHAADRVLFFSYALCSF